MLKDNGFVKKLIFVFISCKVGSGFQLKSPKYFRVKDPDL